jgi:hypothetical protein
METPIIIHRNNYEVLIDELDIIDPMICIPQKYKNHYVPHIQNSIKVAFEHNNKPERDQYIVIPDQVFQLKDIYGTTQQLTPEFMLEIWKNGYQIAFVWFLRFLLSREYNIFTIDTDRITLYLPNENKLTVFINTTDISCIIIRKDSTPKYCYKRNAFPFEFPNESFLYVPRIDIIHPLCINTIISNDEIY